MSNSFTLLEDAKLTFDTHVEHFLKRVFNQKDRVTKVDIGKFVRAARKQKGLKQPTLALEVSTSSSYITQIENGRMVPSLDTANKIERALDLPRHSICVMILKYRLQELTNILLQEAHERGIKIDVRMVFKD